jgi:hypothetical protein
LATNSAVPTHKQTENHSHLRTASQSARTATESDRPLHARAAIEQSGFFTTALQSLPGYRPTKNGRRQAASLVTPVTWLVPAHATKPFRVATFPKSTDKKRAPPGDNPKRRPRVGACTRDAPIPVCNVPEIDSQKTGRLQFPGDAPNQPDTHPSPRTHTHPHAHDCLLARKPPNTHKEEEDNKSSRTREESQRIAGQAYSRAYNTPFKSSRLQGIPDGHTVPFHSSTTPTIRFRTAAQFAPKS